MRDRQAATGLARLAGILRAEAANGLYWGAADDEMERLRRLRAHAAALMAQVDLRSNAAIAAIFDADSGLLTPAPGTEVRVRCGDGATVVRRHRLSRDGESLGQRLQALADTLGAAAPVAATAIGDTDQADLPCPQTFLLVYEIATALPAVEVERLLEPGAPDLHGPIAAVAPAEAAAMRERAPLPVSADVATVLNEVAALAKDGRAATENHYERERQQRVLSLCEHTVVTELDYPRIDCGDLAAAGVATGADTAIFDDERRLLLIRRTDTGQWAMPGGAAEVGEPVGAAAVREAAEETGLDVALTGLVCAFDKRDVRYADSRMPMIMSFTARVIDPAQPIRLAELEASQSRWITRDEVDGIDFFRGHELRVPAAFATLDH